MENRSLSDVVGTPGGLGHFLIGFAMACVGGYLLSNQVRVVGSYWGFYQSSAKSLGIDAGNGERDDVNTRCLQNISKIEY